MIIKELENSKQSLYRNTDGGPATAQTVSREINRLERELEQAREDLRQSRQSLLLEQQRSNAMISSITTELERTRRELDYSRQMAHASGANFERLAYLERELAQTKKSFGVRTSSANRTRYRGVCEPAGRVKKITRRNSPDAN